VSDATGNPLQYKEEGPDRLTVQAAGTGVVVRDQYYPGWRTDAAGQHLRVTPGPDIFRTVTAPAGRAPSGTVELRFTPASVQCGLYSLCAGLALLSAMLTQAGLRRRRNLGAR
jgi:uncharacterized membrane protein YfhO